MKAFSNNRRTLTYDEALMNSENEQLADSGQAHRILKACAGSLDANDMGLVIQMLKDADKLSDSEANSIAESLDPDKEPGMATDSAIRRRLALRRHDDHSDFEKRYAGRCADQVARLRVAR